MAEQKIILGKYVIYEENDYWTCRSCQQRSNGRPYRMIAHLTCNPGKGIKICPKITPEEVEELKRELGLGPDSTDAAGQQPQQLGENDNARQENGNKKRKGASVSGSSGSNPREAEMSPLIPLNPPSAVGRSISASDWIIQIPQNPEKSAGSTGLPINISEQNSSISDLHLAYCQFIRAPLETGHDRERACVPNTYSMENPENSIGATGLRLDLEHNSPFSVSNLSIFPLETHDAPMVALSETSHDQERAYVPNTGNGGFQGTNTVGSSGLPNITHQEQYSSSQGHVDHRNDQHTHPHTSTLRNAPGVEMGGEIVLADEPQPLCPPGFNHLISPVSLSIPETHDAPMMALPETSHDQEWAYVLNTDNGGFQGTNAVGSSELPSIIHQGQYSSSQGQVDHRNDQHAHRHTSTRRDAFGVERAGEIVLADEPQPPCPPGFNPDLWKLYLELDTKKSHWLGWKFSLYKECMSSTDEEERKVLLGFLESACSHARDLSTSSPRCDPSMLYDDLVLNFYEKRLSFERNLLKGLASRVGEIERKTTKEANQGDQKLVEKWNNDRKRWVGHAATFKSDVDELNDAASNVTSLQLQEILQLLSRAHKLRKIGEMVIKTGTALLNPVPKDISHWNPTYMSCGSQFVNQNQMPPTHFAPQV